MRSRRDGSRGVTARRTSVTGAKAETISDSGAVTAFASPASLQRVFIDIESLPTGITMPSAGHSSMPTARTASNSAWSSPGCPAAAIQFADSFTSASCAIGAEAMLVSASPTAMRAEAAASISASGVRSPIAIASPAQVSKLVVVMPASATGTCQGPTIWSRLTCPVTLRSPIVTRKPLPATAGRRSTRSTASAISTSPSASGTVAGATRVNSRCMRGGLPNSTDSGRSTGCVPSRPSASARCGSAVASPTTAQGQRSRSQIAAKRSRSAASTAST